MTDDIVVIGAGGFGRETLDLIEAINAREPELRWRVLGVADDKPSQAAVGSLERRGYVHLGAVDRVRTEHVAAHYVVGIGDPQVRERLASTYDASGWRPATLVHPAAVVGSVVEIAEGAVVCGGVQLSTNTRVGRHVHINPGAVIGHDAELGSFVSVNPGAVISGEVKLGDGTLVGAGAVVLQGLTVGRGALVGASACVTRDVAPGVTVVGVPARALTQADSA